MENLIETYKNNYASDLKNRKKFFKKEISKSEIVYKAALSHNDKDKIFSHQKRIGRKKVELAANRIQEFEQLILSAESFDDIFEYTEKIRKLKIGVGHLWSYDTALHIGFNLNIHPDEIYVQSGVVNGIKMFYPHLEIKRKMEKNLFIGLESLEPFEIENFLCTMSRKNKRHSY